MTSERAQAYGRVVRAVEELAAAKLHPAEQERIREAADILIFAETMDAPGARDALDDIEALGVELVESERFTEERAADLVADVAATGPLTPVL